MYKLLSNLIFNIYEYANTVRDQEIFVASFEMLNTLKQVIKKMSEINFDLNHLYLLVPQLLNQLRISAMKVNLEKDDEISRFKHYRILAAEQLKKYLVTITIVSTLYWM